MLFKIFLETGHETGEFQCAEVECKNAPQRLWEARHFAEDAPLGELIRIDDDRARSLGRTPIVASGITASGDGIRFLVGFTEGEK
jgi:hypothetical protein